MITIIDIFPETVPDKIYLTEMFLPVIEAFIPGIEPGRYSISTWGRIYDKYTQTFFPNQNTLAENRYVYIYLHMQDGSIRTIGMHRLVLMIFKYIPNYDEFEVNHIDGVKYHNWVWNLEWTDQKGNVLHAFETGLSPRGEDVSYATITNKQANMIAEMLSKGVRPIDIEKALKPLFKDSPNAHIRQIASDMARGQAWKHISRNYDMSNSYLNNPKPSKFPFTDEQVHRICKVLEERGINTPYQVILNEINFYFGDADKRERERICAHLSLLRYKKTKKEICDLYNY